ncbi:MAG: hypothetical protein WAU45_17005 [Blastocatellia bacterium]
MSKKTRTILLCTVVLVMIMCIFPPQSVEYHGAIVPVNYEKHGYYFIGKDWSDLPLGLRPKIDYPRLALQCGLAGLLSAGLLLVFAKRKPG